METNRKPHQKIFYDLSEPIEPDDPPKIKRLKQSFETEHQGDMMGCLGVLLFALVLLIKVSCC